ncbi:type I restriction endonuclease subunit R [Acidithiobacillus ferrivorans]|uniref:Type I restriction endonuclease subunit R n=1 Tax=Acidithiobacillus ferrivorans TaxID=160808 RepID=A0A1B9BV41_9PROT|nr:restriction endonuclease subunit S [Acidithiobacillus ferrivorans]OCB01598.1 type I restriction endonuclease subunit R [Acidithiobacillus ferrivorans]
MDAQQFLAEFGHIANAPNGIAQLRELVLCLAMQGKLVHQDSGESTADELLLKVEQDRGRLISSGAIKSPKPWPEIDSSDINHALPSNWAWVRFGEIAMHNSGKTLDSARNSGLPRDYITTSNLYWGRFELGNVKKMLIREEELDKCTARKNDLLICEGGEAGRAAVWVADTEVCFQNHVHRARFYGGINPFFAYRFFEKLNCTREMNAHRKGIGISNMSSKALAMIPFPLPPVEEQSRIVAKVDELMALCDTLEAQQQTRRKLQNNLRQSTLQAVASATSPHELQTSWARLTDNFGRLFHALEDVNEFVAELKNMAVHGLLSLPSTSLSPVDGVVADCDSLRDQYITSGLMRRQILISVADSDVVYPEHWAIAPFDKVAVVIGGVTKGRDLRGRDVVTCHYLAVANVQRGFFKLTDLKTIQIGKEELNKYLVNEGDLLITEGGDWDKVGRTAIWRGGVDNCLHQNHVFKARVPSSSLLNEWVELVFNSGIGRDYFAGASKQTTNLASINMTQLRGFPMPIPPLDEQRAVLAKLDALTEQAGNWREKLERKHRLASLLADATVATFTGIDIEQEEEPMKAPQTELIAPLRLGAAPDIKAQAPLATILTRHNGEMCAKDLWQRFGGEIDAFYAQLKTEVAHGWVQEPAVAEMREKQTDAVSA